MALVLQLLRSSQRRVFSRSVSTTSMLQTKDWRISKGLCVNRTAEGILTDGPDYTFLDGRPTPLLQKQKQRMLKHQDYAMKIVELSSELDCAKQRYQDNIKAEQAERDRIISNRLKPKGKHLKK